MHLTSDEEQFVQWWRLNREKRKTTLKQFMIGLPMATLFVVAILFNFFSGWYKRAAMQFNAQSSLILVLIIAAIAIVVFYAIFSMRYKWEMNEQRYLELLHKMKQQEKIDSNPVT